MRLDPHPKNPSRHSDTKGKCQKCTMPQHFPIQLSAYLMCVYRNVDSTRVKFQNPLHISSRKCYKQYFHHRTSAYQPVQPWDSRFLYKFELLLGTSILQFVEQAPKIALEIENLALNWIYCFSLSDFIRFDWNLHLIALFNPIPIRCRCCFRKELNNKSILYTAHNIQHRSTYHLWWDF